MRRDLATAYAASFARVASWAVVAGLVFRHDGEIAFAALSFQRAILTVVMVSGLGLAPALVILLPREEKLTTAPPAGEPRLLITGFLIATAVAVALAVLGLLTMIGQDASRFWVDVRHSVYPFLAATGVRLMSDVLGARLQTDGRLPRDNLLQAATEAAWVILTIAAIPLSRGDRPLLTHAAIAYLIANVGLLGARFIAVEGPSHLKQAVAFDGRLARLLLGTGAILLLAQCADLLYAPANQFLIEHFLGTFALATYAPLLHIDAGLLLGVTGLANVLLPKSAIAHGAGDRATVRRYYLLGSLTSAALLAGGATVLCVLADPVFRLWFGNPLPATQAILPLVMIHTVIGGSAGVGRSILFGIGRHRAYTLAALIGGLTNVALALLLITHTSLGLKGIIYATILTVTARCLIWMPWYVLRSLRSPSHTAELQSMAVPITLTPRPPGD